MKIDLTNPEFENGISYKILGDEDWIKPVYKHLNLPLKHSLLTGSFFVKQLVEGIFDVSGSIEFVPKLPCSRCGTPIDCSLSQEFDSRVLVASQAAVESEVENEGLDDYYLVEPILDVQKVVNDVVLLAIPQQIVPCDENDPHNEECKEVAESGGAVYSSTDSENSSPFAALKNFSSKKS